MLADACAELGDGALELTSRGNVQIRGLAPGAEVELGERLRAGGLLPSASHETVRNIAASVLSGRDGRGLVDVRPLVSALDAGLCADPELAGLSGRFLFVVDDGRGDVIAMRGDVGLYAVGADEFALVLGGSDTGVRVGGEDAVGVALRAARAFLAVRDGEWRLTEWSDPVGRLAGLLPEASAEVIEVPRVPAKPALGVVEQVDGRFALHGIVPFGRLEPGPLRDAPGLVVTPWRTVVITDLTDVSHSHGLVTGSGSSWDGLTACAGRPGCAKSLTDVRADAARARAASGAGLPVHWSGCDRQCGRPASAHVAVVATADGYQVRRGDQVRAPGHDLTATAAAVARARESE
ncbi:hypothetical protein ACRB68_27980 [Actinomadura sp. RB68]|uniref:Precorrin-3B synthase n=1 Tax=Actinomadura macrotermitis TaxID=2585200 RepID=A0A7K0BUK8_9ACTN|nr:hypothetical protein [Actinomadura macrotermitis]